MQQADEVGAVVHRDGRMALEHRAQMAVIGVAILAMNRVGRDAVFGDQRRRDVVLGRERIARAAEDLRAARLERAQQVGGLAGDVQACAEPLALERLVFGEAFADFPQHRHLPVGPFDSFAAGGGQSEIAHVVLGIGHDLLLTKIPSVTKIAVGLGVIVTLRSPR